MAIAKGNRAMLVNDMRNEEARKKDNSIYAMVNVHDFYATGTTFKVVKITFMNSSLRVFLNVPLPTKEKKAEEDNPDRPLKVGPLLTSVIRHTSCPDHSVTYIVCKL